MIRRFVFLAAACTAGVLTTASPAAAHIDPDPTEAQAGATLSVGFTVEHGCDGSPTTQLDMRLHDGVVDASPDPVEGWDGSIDGNVVTFVGGPLPDDVEATFAVTMTLPATPDTTIYFPFVQRCEVGEIRWIGIPSEAGDELAEPAPALLLTGPAMTTTAPPAPSTTPPTESPATTAASTPANSVDATDAPTTTSPAPVTVGSSESTSLPASEPDDGRSSDTGTIFFIASVAAVGVVGLLAYLRSRSSRTGGTDR